MNPSRRDLYTMASDGFKRLFAEAMRSGRPLGPGEVRDNGDGSRDDFVSNVTQWLIDSNFDGVDFDNESGPFGADYDSLIVDCASAFSSYGFTVGAEVYINRAELTSTGLNAIDHLNLMAY